MALPSSGIITMSNINVELGRARTTSNTSLLGLANLAITSSTPYINRSTPRISHWYGYVHSVADTTPPTTPANFVGVSYPCYVGLTWNASTDNSGGVIVYEIWIGSFLALETIDTFYDYETTDTAFRSFKVRAKDSSGNMSSFTASTSKRALTCI